MRPPTIRDVADRAGVSKSLVSLVLRGTGQVRAEKREAVLRAAGELGYRPNAAARSLSERRAALPGPPARPGGAPPMVGVLLHDLRNPWYVDLLDGLNSLLHAHGMHMLLADARLHRRVGQDPAGPFLDLGADGLVIVGTLPDPAALGAVAERIPVVVAGAREAVPPGVDVVAGDDEQGARLVTEHLLALGHRRVAHIAGYGAVGELRRRSFEAVMREHGVERPVVEASDMTEEGGHRAAVRLLGRPDRPTAVFAVNDMAGVGALSAAEELGLGVPGDLSVVGYDNTSISRLRHLWLTTVDHAGHEVGRRAARCLLDRFEGGGGAGRVQLAAPLLEIRGTTAPPDPLTG
ncbi:LacI family DNA-binding transcriptional regulator [Streptomyces sp. ID05-04B]|uniref:LacI family DNA-binding transcriptional regulator n=1 Tax=unclassified Streptomyces TaxID=2593676 RepID=UPI000D1AA369|nr:MULTISPECIES: LacI family DNA-binding transcriptional regulator [unclassified Streptomyces]AVV45845.1 LacI family transcriptional regulator [Streptomyces sp. P3]MDX5570131.1 LacI family DNA-binding transcriptional regulator [Streptomyces sp. ID05-04B]